MVVKTDGFGFSTHSLERGLERLLQLEAPYSEEQLNNMEELIRKNMTWSRFSSAWVLEDFNAELIIKEDSVVTIILRKDNPKLHRPVSEYQKTYPKKHLRMGRTRNQDNKYKKDSYEN